MFRKLEENITNEQAKPEAQADLSALERLPLEVMTGVISHLVPNHRRIAQASRSLYTAFHFVDQRYWRAKFKKHFPHLFREVDKKKDVDWRVEFIAAEAKDYKYLSPLMAKTFHMIKEADVAGLRAIPITLDTIFIPFDGSPCLMATWAMRGRNQKLLDYLYTLHNENAAHKFGITQLHCAVMFRQPPETIIALIEQHGEVDTVSSSRFTPLLDAAYAGWIELVEVLVASGANIEAADVGGCTSLYLAAQNDHANVVDHLLAHGANVDAKSNTGAAPIVVAAQNNCIAALKCLIRHGANINAATGQGATALFIAAQEDNAEVVELLLANDKIDVNAALISDKPSLIDFTKKYSVEIRQCMLTFIDAQPNPDHIRMRPIDIAMVLGHRGIAEMLQQKEERLRARLSS